MDQISHVNAHRLTVSYADVTIHNRELHPAQVIEHQRSHGTVQAADESQALEIGRDHLYGLARHQ
jgi:hypothetical protein